MSRKKHHHPNQQPSPNQQLEREEVAVLKKIERVEEEIERDIHPARKAKSATLTFTGGSTMPATITVGKTANSVFTEFDGPNGTGNQVKPIGPVTFASDNTAVATVDASSGVATGVSAGTCNISGLDAGNSISASDVLTVTAASGGTAQSATLSLTAN